MDSQIDNFSDAIETISDGELNARASKLLRELAAAVETNGGTGKLALTIAVQRGKEGQVLMKPTLKITKPEPAFDSTRLFVDGSGALSREDPRQMKLPKVTLPGAKLIQINPATADDKDPA